MKQPLSTIGLHQPQRRAKARVYKPLYANMRIPRTLDDDAPPVNSVPTEPEVSLTPGMAALISARVGWLPPGLFGRCLELVAKECGLSVHGLRTRCNESQFVGPRQVAMWLLVRCGCSLKRAGRFCGGFHHTTVLHSIRQVERRMKESAAARSEAERLLAEVRRPCNGD